jgi:arabinose operon protein AraL
MPFPTTQRISTVVFDVHGVLVDLDPELSGGLAPGKVVQCLRDSGRDVFFISNASSMNRHRMVEVLSQAGVNAKPSETVSAGVAAAMYLRETFGRFRMLFIGQPRFRQIIERVCKGAICDDAPHEAVVAGRDPDLCAAKLQMAMEAARRGAVLVATSRDPIFRSNGQVISGPGETVRRVEQAMGVAAHIVGKPNPFILQTGLGLTSEQIHSALLVGDSVEFDVACGRAVGAKTVLLAKQPSETATPPDYTIQQVDQLLSILEV